MYTSNQMGFVCKDAEQIIRFSMNIVALMAPYSEKLPMIGQEFNSLVTFHYIPVDDIHYLKWLKYPSIIISILVFILKHKVLVLVA